MVFGRKGLVYQQFEEVREMTKPSEFHAKHQLEIEFTEKLEKLMQHTTKFDH
jgi:hypothetical protein